MWEEFYRERDYDRIAYLAGEEMTAMLERFVERVETPETMLSVGSGPAVAEFTVADRFPDLHVVATDLSPDVVADNRALAAERGVENIEFAVDALPRLETEGEYDIVYCVATLFFVPEVEASLESLAARVAPGGHLVVTYADEQTLEWVRSMEEWRQAFFEPVLDESAVRTRGEVEEVLGPVSDYWAAVGRADDPYAERAPTVFTGTL